MNETTQAMNETTQNFTVKKLRTRGPRKGETHYTSGAAAKGGRVLGGGWEQDANYGAAATGGRWSVAGGQTGIGSGMVRNLDGVKKNYADQAKADRRQAALDRRNEALDALLADIREN